MHKQQNAASSDLERTQSLRVSCLEERLVALQEREELHVLHSQTLKEQLEQGRIRLRDAQTICVVLTEETLRAVGNCAFFCCVTFLCGVMSYGHALLVPCFYV